MKSRGRAHVADIAQYCDSQDSLPAWLLGDQGSCELALVVVELATFSTRSIVNRTTS